MCGRMHTHFGADTRKEVIASQANALPGRCVNNLRDVREWDKAAGPAGSLRFHPPIDAGPVNADDIGHLRSPAEGRDNLRCWFHAAIVAPIATIGKAVSSDASDRHKSRKSLHYGMARKKTFKSPPLSPMNQWVRDAFLHAEANGNDLSYDEVAVAMTKAVGSNYDKSMVQKMTTERKVSLAEASVISQMTGYPLPEEKSRALSLDERAARLAEPRRRIFLALLDQLEAAEATGPAAE